MTIDTKTIQTLIAYASVVFGVLTQTLSGIQLSPTASIILGLFGVLLHPKTSITSPPEPPTTIASTFKPPQ